MNDTFKICPLCDEGELEVVEYTDSFKHGTKQIEVSGLLGCECDLCGGEPILPEQITYNQIKISDAKRVEAGLLSSAEIKAIRARLHISQREASLIFGGGQKAFSKYERGDVIQSEAMDKLLRLAKMSSEAFALLKSEAQVCLDSSISAYKPATKPRVKVLPRSSALPLKGVKFRATDICHDEWIAANGKAA